MAAIVPNQVIETRLGSFKLTIARFTTTTVNVNDTWASGISGIVDWVSTSQKGQTTQASAGANATVSSGTWTFKPGEDGAPLSLWIVSSD